MDIILIIEKFPSISKSEINEGKVANISLKITDFLRSTFLLSNNLLHNNNLTIFCANQFPTHPYGLIIQFQGKNLRYLAPDERGILFLLLKIQKIITGEGQKQQEKKEHKKFTQLLKSQSTPGIYLKRGEFQDIWEMYPESARDFITFSNSTSENANIPNIEELKEKIHSKSTLVFLEKEEFVFEPPPSSKISNFRDESWKAKFYESELISLLQSKITD